MNNNTVMAGRTQAVATMLVGSIAGASLSLMAAEFFKLPLPPWFYIVLGVLTISTLIIFSIAILLDKQSLNILTMLFVGAIFFWLALFATPWLITSLQGKPSIPGADAMPPEVIYRRLTVVITPVIVTATPEHFVAPNAISEVTPVPPIEPQPQPAVQEITQLAQITASKSTAASKDLCDPPRTTTYDVTNLVDGQRDTAWRVAGQGRGSFITLEFPFPVAIRQIDIIPGYAKVDPCNTNYDWCLRNHIPWNVTIELSSGAKLDYSLQDTCEWQNLLLDDLETRWIRLTIIDSYPNKVSHYADFAAVSEIKVHGWAK
jgi:hypothetical protein